jgi:predicted GIY-YIG superfamily endonuclease
MLGAGAEHLRVNQRDALWLVSETGVYTLAASSMATPDAARRLRRWMIRELMPSVWAAAPPSVTRSDLPLRFRDVEVERRQPPPALTHTVSRGGPKHALYRLRSGVGGLLYVGISLNLAARLAQHRDCQPWWNEVVSVQVEPHPTREAALAAEREAIRTERPLHNIQHRVA